MTDGRMVEVAAVGREGAVGHMVGLGDDRATGECMVQIPGDSARTMRAGDAFSEAAARDGYR